MYCSLILCLLGVSSIHAANILLLPLPLKSHIGGTAAAGKALAEAGHQVHIMLPEKMQHTATRNNLHSLLYSSHLVDEMDSLNVEKGSPLIAKGQLIRGSKVIADIISKYIPEICHQILFNETLMDEVEKIKFDLVLSAGSSVSKCMNTVAYKYDLPFIIFIPYILPWEIGIPAMPSYEPMMALPYTSKMNFFQRSANLFVYVMTNIMMTGQGKSTREYVPEKQDIYLSDLHNKAELWLTWVEQWCVDYPRISAPHYHMIGGASVQSSKALPGHLEDFMSAAEEGVIIMSFGTSQVYQLAFQYHINKFMSVFSQIKQRVIFQCGKKIDNLPDNVKVLPWIPQNDLLGHSKTVLFITHGGANGQMEAVSHGVPIISIGVMIEQVHNSVRVQHQGFGKQLSLHEFSSTDLVQAIDDVVTNSTYRENTKRCAEIMESFPRADENVVFWVNHILRFGGSHLRPESLNMPIYQMLMLDVIGGFVVLVLIIFISMVYTCRYLTGKCCRNKKKKEKKL